MNMLLLLVIVMTNKEIILQTYIVLAPFSVYQLLDLLLVKFVW